MKVLSLFDGISCGMVALERAGIPVERYVAYEIDKYALKVSEKNYPEIEHCGNVIGADFTQYKGFDLLIGGSPCTYWSIAKNNRETTPDGEGGKLFLEYVRALKESGCRYFLYENNYSIHKNIKAFISEQLGVEPIMINSALVSAQQRKRCYWTNIPNVVQPKDRGILLKDILENGFVTRYNRKLGIISGENKALSLCTSDWRGLNRNQTKNAVAEPIIYQRPHGFNKGGVKFDKSPTLTAQESWQDNNHIVEPVCVNSQSGNNTSSTMKQPSQNDRVYEVNGKNPALGTGWRTNIAVNVSNVSSQDYKSTLNIYTVKNGKICFITKNQERKRIEKPYDITLPDGDYIIRKLTPIEAERLQTLSDNYTEGISNTQRYKCIGNGWTVDVIAHILRGINEA